MDSSPTEVYLPSNFPFPVQVASIDAPASSSVQRGTRLLTYSFRYTSSTPGSHPEIRFGTWDSAIEGTIDSWNIKPGDEISRRIAQERPVLTAIELCKHGMQVGGLCVLCGKDMTNMDYTGPSDAARASIQMTHSAFGPTVSLEVAQRIEQETAMHLLQSRKLSLIVDLDQTIVHATVDSTVGDWIGEGEAWETRQAQKATRVKDDVEDSDDDSSSESDDECNPNWEALKDVKKFKLDPESLVSPSMRGLTNAKGKAKLIESEGCIYYIKPRPGWNEFLQEMAKKYEMHVYTMGTRAYAEEVCAAIDPEGKIFGGRLLSRDESGSLTQKSLQRLFPCDTSMVVIIDDRADVWEWSPNLIKVIPYEFFVGIGDINSSFLPKVDPITGPIQPQPPKEAKEPPDINRTPLSSDSNDSTASSPSISSTDAEEDALLAKDMLTQNVLALEAQLEERPLAKMQEALEAEEIQAEKAEELSATESGSTTPHPTELPGPSPTPTKPIRKPLLKNDDCELERVGKLLQVVHEKFFALYDDHSKGKAALNHTTQKEAYPKPSYGVTKIIPQIRAEVFSGVHILFSSVIPLDIKPESTEIWRVAHMFGAKCYTELTNEITHVVAAKRGTIKVDTARKRGGIHIVWLSWFNDSIALWRRQDEMPYLLDEPTTTTTLPSGSSPPRTSSDPEPEERKGSNGTEEEPSVEPPELDLGDIDWNDINDEVEAAMNESDDEDTRSERSTYRSGNASEDEWAADRTHSSNGTPKASRKRSRSVTPSESLNNSEDDALRSPLAKRKKVAAGRSGSSRLKETINAHDLQPNPIGDDTEAYGLGLDFDEGDPNYDPVLAKARVASWSTGAGGEDMDDTGESSAGDGDDFDDDDFLARELEEEWG